MMSRLQNIDHSETLFSFELLVENIRLDKVSEVSDELAVGVRLLDFPTLLIYQPEQMRGGKPRREEGAHRFNRGKCCFFKMNLSSLHTHLASTPLYAMVLDVKEEIPKLVGTSLISLNKVMRRVRQDVTQHGVSAPSSHGERGLVGVCNLRGEKIGSVSLSYKLQSLGGSLLPNAAQRRGIKSNIARRREEEQHSNAENKPAESLPLDSEHASSPDEDEDHLSRNNEASDKDKLLQNEDKQDKSVCDKHTGENGGSQTPRTVKENNFEEDLTLFCPPHLFYCNTAEERSKKEGGDCTFLDPNSQSFTFEDTEDENKSEGESSPTVAQRGKQDAKTPENKGTGGVTPNVLGEAIQQLPLLNALLVELSQLNGPSPQQPLSIHPNLSWIYRPASTEPLHRNTQSFQETRQGISPNSKLLHSPRNCSTPLDGRASLRGKDKQEESKSYSTSPRKKLVFGTTKTFNLRLKQISPSRVKTRECVGLIQNKTQSPTSKEKRKTKSRKSESKPSSGLNENIETMIQNLPEDSSRQQTITMKEKGRHERVQRKRDAHSPRNSEKASLPEKDSRLVHIPSVEGDISPPKEDESEHHSESHQSHSDTLRGNSACSGSRRHSSSKSSFSGEGNDEEYADDFNSLEPSDAFSPHPLSSPEPSRSRTPKSPVLPISDSGSEGLYRRAALPVPVKAPSSPPQRALRGTHIIRPRTHASAISFSSSDDDDADGDTSVSLQTILSRKQMTDSSGGGRSSGADSLISWRGQRRESTRNSRAARGRFSAESVSSCDPQEAEEVEDELGTLDFGKEYQHISELVANKLPGYTM
ncbi:microtubule-associated protein 10 [Labrus bergylta]|uniref:microtubule-associated protein 10 n=1 Tax=Labrus bergylta TaxID=56723 RepID=UPI003313DB0F